MFLKIETQNMCGIFRVCLGVACTTRMVISEPPSSSQVSGFNSDSTFSHLQFLQKALFRIGMERIVPNRHSRRNSTGNLTFEHSGYKEVLSRYLQPPYSSCHDNCKQSFLDLPLEFKPTATPPLEKPSSTTSKKPSAPPPPIPKPSTKDVKINKTSLLKHQIKPASSESKSQDFFKSKGDDEQDDPFYIPPSRPTRRYSEVTIPTHGLGDVLDSPSRSGKTPRKNTKPPPNSVKTAAKTSENNGKVSKKVQPLKPQSGSPVDQGSKKSRPVKPVGEIVQEKKTEKSDKIQISTSGSSMNEERVSENGDENGDENGARISSSSKEDEKNGITSLEVKKTENRLHIPASENGQNGLQIFSSSKKDETPQKDGQKNSLTPIETKKTEKPARLRRLATEYGIYSPRKSKFKKIIDSEPPGSSSPRRHKFGHGKMIDENKNIPDNKTGLRRLSSDSVLHTSQNHHYVHVVDLRRCQVQANKTHVGLNNIIEETASKLIRTRKSKVKALVGAFEMISKPTEQTDS